MSLLSKLSSQQNRRDEVPNQQLARELADAENLAGIQEIAANLFNRDRNIQSDCIKVMYEIGYIKPWLVESYFGDFIRLLDSKHNRLVWGAMIGLSVVAGSKAADIYPKLDAVYRAMEQGSVITVDNGVKVLAAIAVKKLEYHETIFPLLLEHLRTCRPKDVAQHAESIFAAVNPASTEQFVQVLGEREGSLTKAQLARVKKIYRILSA